ncbi:Putative ubiquinone biosynthesis protein [Methyloversatilis universalis FAM5]|jgi:ubiquinone biosynthesis monooxygenase Coq7|uniref:3-demethoxyubiquinol 3-hydroxylase n=1 Tax=Methyloversatilis universalis (strain ATCC BAA-1314 / DSM 25237 / JCM 13912 / CCUG 52030 / FAM5) TaxID=1000565 RepID=F5RF08_METUF|nr:2-polyprenyl-3-methyl-6-methoxy-1,4-benzoquinone monooxygenase [Methyloversatilis universalis]EGK70664.1 Putative ubiquinone biosynthesis protein [Methyloversatilis universalis FAM5]
MLDRLITEFDRALRTLAAPARTTRPLPGADLPEADLDEAQRRQVGALMRVNHVGEICAQALYQGQALTCRDPSARDALRQAAVEETEHLNWTASRMSELGSRPSLLNPLWYGGALAIGVTAGIVGDKWNLGFLAETEKQVEAHLQSHLDRLPPADQKSWRILEQMRQDEREHAHTAERLGAAELPTPVRVAMRAASRVMTGVAYYI